MWSLSSSVLSTSSRKTTSFGVVIKLFFLKIALIAFPRCTLRVNASACCHCETTNRDLSSAITAGAFRSDLFYRLNVFPIQVPPLRKRKEDIPLLIEYFVRKFAEKVAKHIHKIEKRTLELCQDYAWPGNIRELQNIVERSMILCSGDTFSIDEGWLSMEQPGRTDTPGPLMQTLQDQEKEMIEAALAETRGKVAGAKGAAARLGIPPSTLESKIKQLKINKENF